MNLTTMTLKELQKLEGELPVVIAAKKAAEAERVKAAAADLVAKHGFTMKDLFGDAGKSKVVPKYRDPKSGKTWSGRGRAPLWMPKRKSEYANVAI